MCGGGKVAGVLHASSVIVLILLVAQTEAGRPTLKGEDALPFV